MKISKKIWDEFVYGGHLVGLGDVVALYVLAQLLEVTVTWDFLAIVYLLPFSVNTFDRLRGIDGDAATNSNRSIVLKNSVNIYQICVFLAPTLIFSLIYLYGNLMSAVLVAVLFSIGILYTVTLKKITKYIRGFKSFVLALTYSSLIVLLMVYYNQPFSMAVFLIMSFYFLRLFINTVFCDIKDIKSDKEEGLKTFAVIYGEKATVSTLIFLNILSIIPIIYGVYQNIIPVYSIALLLTVVYSFYHLRIENVKKFGQSFYFSVIVEGEFIFWIIYLYLGKKFL